MSVHLTEIPLIQKEAEFPKNVMENCWSVGNINFGQFEEQGIIGSISRGLIPLQLCSIIFGVKCFLDAAIFSPERRNGMVHGDMESESVIRT